MCFNCFPECNGIYFSCDEPEVCHHMGKWCDGKVDCRDEFDEVNHECNCKQLKSIIFCLFQCSRNIVLKFGKFRKLIFLFSFEPENERNYFLISVLRISNGANKKIKASLILNTPYSNVFSFSFLIRPILKARAKIKK